MSELSAAELREMYFEAIRRECKQPRRHVIPACIKFAKKLCEADGHDPDRIIFCTNGVVPENGPRGSLIHPDYASPAWVVYYDMASAVVSYINTMEQER